MITFLFFVIIPSNWSSMPKSFTHRSACYKYHMFSKQGVANISITTYRIVCIGKDPLFHLESSKHFTKYRIRLHDVVKWKTPIDFLIYRTMVNPRCHSYPIASIIQLTILNRIHYMMLLKTTQCKAVIHVILCSKFLGWWYVIWMTC